MRAVFIRVASTRKSETGPVLLGSRERNTQPAKFWPSTESTASRYSRSVLFEGPASGGGARRGADGASRPVPRSIAWICQTAWQPPRAWDDGLLYPTVQDNASAVAAGRSIASRPSSPSRTSRSAKSSVALDASRQESANASANVWSPSHFRVLTS